MKKVALLVGIIVIAMQGIASYNEKIGTYYWGYDYNCNTRIGWLEKINVDSSSMTGHLDIPSSHYISNGGWITFTSISDSAIADRTLLPSVSIPSTFTTIGSCAFQNDYKLTNVIWTSSISSIGNSAFCNCISLPRIEIPQKVRVIKASTFKGCESLSEVKLSNILGIESQSFQECINLKSITIPASATYIESSAFCKCSSLTNITFMGDMPTISNDAFVGTPRSMTITVGENSTGWDYYKKNGLTAPWEDRKVIKPGYPEGGDVPVYSAVALATTNVVIHYLTTNVPVNVTAPISKDTAIVNVMTEIEGGNIAIPDTWAKNYPNFEKRFGSDFSAALTKYTGKYDGAGNPLFVWQDYVAGTDPTDVYDVFTATITLVEGKPQVQWDPVLIEKEAAKRVYTKYGKVQLQDEWEVVPEGEESKYNFFKVTVRMK